MTGPVRFAVAEGIAVVTIAAPPVNALSAALRGALLDAVRQAEADPAIRALVIAAEGRTFIAGADISEFGKPPTPPTKRSSATPPCGLPKWWGASSPAPWPNWKNACSTWGMTP